METTTVHTGRSQDLFPPVTPRKRWFDAFIEDSIDPVIAFDDRFQIKLVNRNGALLLGKSEKVLVGMSIESCGTIGAIIAPALSAVLGSKTGISCDHEIQEGEKTRTFQASYSPISGDGGEIIGIFLILREITDRQTHLKQLVGMNKRIETQAKALEVFDVVSEADLSGQILYANDKFCALSGHSRLELIGKNYRLLNSGHHPKAFFQEMWRVISRGRAWVGEIRNRAKDGSFFWVQTIITPISNGDEKVTRFLSIQRDITQERDRSIQAEDETFRLRQILDSAPSIVASLDLERNIVFCNKAFLEMTGYPEKEALELNWLNFFVPSDQKQAIQEELLQLLGDRKKTLRFQTQLLCKTGETKDISWRAAAIKNRGGVALGVHLCGEEMPEGGAETAGRSQESQSLQKRDIIGFVSHELKRGLLSVNSGLEMIYEGLRSETVDTFKIGSILLKVTRKAKRLEHLSRNLLDNLKGTGPIRTQFQSVSLKTLLRGTWDRFREDLPEGKKFSFLSRLPEQDIIVQWDPVKIEQVLMNLLANATQYSKPEGGEIALSASKVQNQILVSVSDRGIGIPRENIESVFDLFTRGDNAERKKTGNFGVGLKFCRDVVLKHQGRIWVESKLKIGTTVYFLLPIDPKVSRLCA